jgi:DNA polymerase-3 subunit alpha
MNCVKDLGLLKIDLLAVQTLTAIDLAARTINERRGIDVDLSAMPLDDKATFDLLCRAEVMGVFQLEASAGMRDLVKKLAPRRFEDIIALLALYRPGTLRSGMEMIDSFIRVGHKQEKPSYLHELLRPILEETNGLIIYQEQVMTIANKVGGFSLEEADELRKAMSKKKRELIASFRPRFIDGAEKKSVNAEIAGQIFDQMEYFAGYGFNKSHAAAYALVCYQTAYLKTHYTPEFMAAVLTVEHEKTEKVAELIEECKRLKITVLPPDVNESGADFTVVPGGIRFGLMAVKGVGERAVNAIVAARKEHGAFTSLHRFCEFVDQQSLNRAAVERLIRCGAFDSLKATRAALLAALEQAVQFGSTRQKEKRNGQGVLFGFDSESANLAPSYPALPTLEEMPQDQLLAGEKDTLGLYITSHPLLEHLETIASFSTTHLADIVARTVSEGTKVTVGGILSDISTILMRHGAGKDQRMVRFKIRDISHAVSVIAFPGEFEKHKEFLVSDRIVFIRGKVDFRREEPTIRVDSVVPIERAREEFTGSLTISLTSTGTDTDLLERLKRVLDAHPGSCTVFMHIATAGGKKVMLKTASRFMVSPSSAFVRDAEALLGKGSLRFHRRM